MIKKKKYSLTYPRIAAIGFALIILIGAGLLMLPISTKNGSVSFIDALFTATSATCITGLVPFDTFTTWSVFGQLVILCLIQTGGLGFITILALLTKIINKRISLKQKMMLKDSVGSLTIGEIKSLIRSVISITAITEAAGAVILAFRFVPMVHNLRRGIYMAVFTSVSAYCNAGFDLMGCIAPSSSLTSVNNDAVVLITISLLIVIGGLGFFVWEDVRKCRFNPKKLREHSKLTIVSTVVLLVLGAVLMFVFEYNNQFKDMSLPQKLLNALFCSVTPRTAGFNSIDTGAMTAQSKLVTIVLMFIGGSSGSTAGGVKTTTVAVLLLCVVSTLKNGNELSVFKKRIENDVVKKSAAVVMIGMCEIFTATVILSVAQGDMFSLSDILFECTSAIGTVGMTTGITPMLSPLSKTVIMLLMYIGRMTSLIFALSFISNKPKTTAKLPKGNLMIG